MCRAAAAAARAPLLERVRLCLRAAERTLGVRRWATAGPRVIGERAHEAAHGQPPPPLSTLARPEAVSDLAAITKTVRGPEATPETHEAINISCADVCRPALYDPYWPKWRKHWSSKL